jgi:hypothetical protein
MANASGSGRSGISADIKEFVKSVYIIKAPSYGNSFFYSLGFLLLTCFAVLVVTGIIMVFFGPFWWDTNPAGVFIRSIHLWAAQAMTVILVLHLLTIVSTSAYRKKKLIWMLGAVMFFLVLLQVAFGVVVRGDFVSQWNALSAADLWNGMYLGYWINPINWGAVYGWHIAIVPIVLLVLMGTHYLMVRSKGISKPYRNDIPYRMVEIDHRKMYMRAIMLVALILAFAFLFRAQYVAPMTIQRATVMNSSAVAVTLLNEFNYSSGTATYMDSIDPYHYSTRQVYVTVPYDKYLQITNGTNYEAQFLEEPRSVQTIQLADAFSYFSANSTYNTTANATNPLIPMVSSLLKMARSGTYDSVINGDAGSYLDTTYQLRFLSDTGEMYALAAKDKLLPQDWGIVKGGTSWWPPGVWLGGAYNWLEVYVLGNDPNQDRDGGFIAEIALILFIAFPFIPYANELPDKLKMYKIVWNRFTIPELRRKKKRNRR